MTNDPCLRCNPRKVKPSDPNYDSVYDGHYTKSSRNGETYCGSCGATKGKRVVKRWKKSPIRGKRGRNSGKTNKSKSKGGG